MTKYTEAHIVTYDRFSVSWPTNSMSTNVALYIPGRAVIYFKNNQIDNILFDYEQLKENREKIGTNECLGSVKVPSGWVDKVLQATRTLKKKEGKNLANLVAKAKPFEEKSQDIPNQD